MSRSLRSLANKTQSRSIITKCMCSDKKINIYIYHIRECGSECSSTLYVGLAHAVPPTNTKFKPLLLLTQAGIPYSNTHKHGTSYFKSTLTFLGLSAESQSLPPDKIGKFLRFFIIILIIIIFNKIFSNISSDEIPRPQHDPLPRDLRLRILWDPWIAPIRNCRLIQV